MPRLPSITCPINIICVICVICGPLPSPAQTDKKKKNKTQPLPENVTVTRDITYATPNDTPLLLDLYLPEQKPVDPIPVVVWVHGGGWKNGSKDKTQAAFLAQHGFAVASINYRLTDAGQWPDQINDCYAAVRFLRDNADKYHLNPNHIGAWGSSAGGHLVALMGTRPYPEEESTSSRVQAVCDWFGPSELLTMPYNVVGDGRTVEDVAQSNGAKLLGNTVYKVPDLAKDASALDHVSADDPPFLIMHGSADPGVPVVQSEKLHDALKNAGVDSTLIVLDGAGHGGEHFKTDDTKQTVLTFFQEHLQ
ncbi:MAG: alpha/beta hydrolase [Verrucomicrobiota bacterium]